MTRIDEAAKTIADFHDCPCDGECDACIGEARALDAAGHLMPDLPGPLNDASGDPYWQVGPYTRVWTGNNPHGPNHIYVGDPYDVECTAMFINLNEAEKSALAILRAVQIERERQEHPNDQ